MSQVGLLAFAFLLCLPFFTAAQTTGRFEDIQSDGATIAQFDTETISYEKDPYSREVWISVWIKTSPDDYDQSYSLNHYLLRKDKREILVLDRIGYTGSGRILYQTANVYEPSLWDPVIPETTNEYYYTAVLRYAKANDKKLLQAYNKDKPQNKLITTARTIGDFLRVY
ncbi:putative secreted protein [Propionispora sp. 2/2-37]|nr:putative secreted protein [Propionispora sp. 2/2-37]